ALGWTVAQASVRGLVESEGVFLRTPKVRGEATWRDALRANRTEALVATVLLASAVLLAVRAHTPASYLLVGLLVWQAAGLLAAPTLTIAALRAELSDELRRRRRTEWLRERVTSRVRPLPVGATALGVAATGVLAVFLFAPGGLAPRGPLTDLFRQAHDKPPAFTTPVVPPTTRSPTPARPTPTGTTGTAPTTPATGRPSGPAGTQTSPGGTGSVTPTASATVLPSPTGVASPSPSPTPSASRPAPSHSPSATSRPTATPSPSTSRRPSSSPSPSGGRPSVTPSR
ncbi:MAG: hypothetical protein ACYDAQ_07710, partial [Mycobacteriales bacterium]